MKEIIENPYVQYAVLCIAILALVWVIIHLMRARRRDRKAMQEELDKLREALENERKEAAAASLRSLESLEEVKKLLTEPRNVLSDQQSAQPGDSEESEITDAFPWKIKPSILKNALTYTKRFKLDKSNQSAVFEGTKGELYTTTLYACDCLYFQRFRVTEEFACKHMIRLAMELGIIDKEGKLICKAPDNQKAEKKGYGIEGNPDRVKENGNFKIIKEMGTYSISESGWRREVNLISWKGADPKVDIRRWSPDQNIPSNGMTFTQEELKDVAAILRKNGYKF